MARVVVQQGFSTTGNTLFVWMILSGMFYVWCWLASLRDN